MIHKLLPKRVAIIPIRDPDKLNVKSHISKAELEYVGMGQNQLRKESFIHVPDQAKERTDQGIVKYIGPDVRGITVGDYVIFNGYSGTLVYLTGEDDLGKAHSEELIIMHTDFIYAVLDEIPFTPVPGLYFKIRDKHGDVIYEPANYEVVLALVRDAFKNPEWQSRINVKTPKLKLEDYDVLKGG